jgi:nuclear pore complex protein Nup160
LACLLDFPKSPEGDVMSPCFPSPAEVINLVRRFSSLIMCGRNFECGQTFLGYTINLSAVLIRHGQYEAAKVLYFIFGLKFIRNILCFI